MGSGPGRHQPALHIGRTTVSCLPLSFLSRALERENSRRREPVPVYRSSIFLLCEKGGNGPVTKRRMGTRRRPAAPPLRQRHRTGLPRHVHSGAAMNHWASTTTTSTVLLSVLRKYLPPDRIGRPLYFTAAGYRALALCISTGCSSAFRQFSTRAVPDITPLTHALSLFHSVYRTTPAFNALATLMRCSTKNTT